jgi:glucose-6-phosphate 1-epimerase
MRKLWQGIQTTQLQSPDGASALIADHGAHLLSWVPAGGAETLFMSRRSRFGTDDAIRGGVPIIFPQFGERGSGKRHGFARVCDWRLEFAGTEQGRAVARYVLTHRDTTETGWPHQFSLTYAVALYGQQLQLSLSVHNPSNQHWQFNAALHTYLHVSDVAAAYVNGLQGIKFIDQVQAGMQMVQGDEALAIDGEIDRIYLDTPETIRVRDSKRIVIMQQRGFADTVIWNPGMEKSMALTDLAPGSYKSFLCVEAAAVEHPITLAPGAQWQGVQTMTIKNSE